MHCIGQSEQSMRVKGQCLHACALKLGQTFVMVDIGQLGRQGEADNNANFIKNIQVISP